MLAGRYPVAGAPLSGSPAAGGSVSATVAVDVGPAVDVAGTVKVAASVAVDVGPAVDASLTYTGPVTGTVAVDITLAVDVAASEKFPSTVAVDVTLAVDVSGTVSGGSVSAAVAVEIAPSVDVVLAAPMPAGGGRRWVHEELPDDPKPKRKKAPRRPVPIEPVDAVVEIGLQIGLATAGQTKYRAQVGVEVAVGMAGKVSALISVRDDEHEVMELMQLLPLFPTD